MRNLAASLDSSGSATTPPSLGWANWPGYNISGEQLGVYPDEPIPASEGGVGRMCSFGQGVSMTPLQLGAFVAAIANGGTLYYLQHPTSPMDDRQLRAQGQADTWISPNSFRIFRMGWRAQSSTEPHAVCVPTFRSSPSLARPEPAPTGDPFRLVRLLLAKRLWAAMVTVFFLEGGRPTFGPRAAELTGEFYQNLWRPQLLCRQGIDRFCGGTGVCARRTHPAAIDCRQLQ